MSILKKTSTTSAYKKKTFLKIFKSKACNISLACESVPIDRQTYYNWMNKDEKFKASVEALQESMTDLAESKLMQNIGKGKEASIFFYLKCKAKKRGYIERQEIEQVGEGATRPTIINVIAPGKKK